MTVILDTSVPRALDELVERLLALKPNGPVEAWLFEDKEARRAAETRLARAGIAAKFRSTYKPLIHFFLEEFDISTLSELRIAYPVRSVAAEKRFVLEAYPLAALCGQCELVFVPSGSGELVYRVEAVDHDGGLSTSEVFAPNRVHKDATGADQLSPTGWLRVPSVGIDESLPTDFETLYTRVLDAVAGYDFGPDEPHFEELNIRISLAATDQPLDWADEVVSLREAMHEDIFFSLHEMFQARVRDGSGRTVHPGQIVPMISGCGALQPSARVETRPLAGYDASLPRQVLATATHPISLGQVLAELENLGGQHIEARSRAGRMVPGSYKRGSDAGVIISGGQHANETTGIVGALRAGQLLAQRPEAHFAISPVENPDGYALHHRLCAENARHMNHAARYTSNGENIEVNGTDSAYEKAIRQEAFALMDANFHINLHGYPAHEFTRPLSGYLPLGGELWTIPKGFLLILFHDDDWADVAQSLVEGVTRRLAGVPGLIDYNQRQMKIYEAHAGPLGSFTVINGIPVWNAGKSAKFQQAPLLLVTEFPDETIYGDTFVLGHTVQMETVTAAYDCYQELMTARSFP